VWWWWAARGKHGGLQRQAQQREGRGTRVDVDVDEAHPPPPAARLPLLPPPIHRDKCPARGQAAPCVMPERVAGNWWLAREAASAVMGLWSWPWGRRGPSGFGSASTAEEVTAGVDATNLTAIVTGLSISSFLLLSVQDSDAELIVGLLMRMLKAPTRNPICQALM